MPALTLKVLGRDYQFSVNTEDDERLLRESANLLNERGQALRETNRTLTMERLAVYLALQIASDSISGRLARSANDSAALDRVHSMLEQCQKVLDPTA